MDQELKYPLCSFKSLGMSDTEKANSGGGDESSRTARLPTAVMTAPEHKMVAVGFNSGEVRRNLFSIT